MKCGPLLHNDVLCMYKVAEDEATCMGNFLDDLNHFLYKYNKSTNQFSHIHSSNLKLKKYSPIWITNFYTIHQNSDGIVVNSLHTRYKLFNY